MPPLTTARWRAYLERFHTGAPGITEDVLASATDGSLNPYRWLTDGVDPEAWVLDVGCGSGPARPPHASRWTGIDRSAGELARAAAANRRRLVRGDVVKLPMGEATADVITAAMSLMLVSPLDDALNEIRRTLSPGGELRILLPSRRPLTVLDRVSYLRLFAAARSATQWPKSEMSGSATRVLHRHGFTVVSDERRRFERPMPDPPAAERFVESWYMPDLEDERRASLLARAQSMAPFSIGIPLRRIVAQCP